MSFGCDGVDDVQELQFFYKPEDEHANMDSGTHLQSRTQIGLATSESIPISTPSGSFSLGSQEIPMADEGNSTSFGFGQRVMEATARIQAPPSPPPQPRLPLGTRPLRTTSTPSFWPRTTPRRSTCSRERPTRLQTSSKGLNLGARASKTPSPTSPRSPRQTLPRARRS